jgi:hypothetical protein
MRFRWNDEKGTMVGYFWRDAATGCAGAYGATLQDVETWPAPLPETVPGVPSGS